MGESRITPSGIINDAVSMIGKMNDSSFPIDVFPNKIRNIILNMYEYLAFPIDYTACSMMTAISTCIGNTHILHFKTGWDIKCIIYMALVGRPGANKSHPLKTAFEPLFRFDKEQKEIYNEEHRKYESIMSLSKKERLEQGFDMFPREPVRTRFLVSDITQEAMAKSISENPRGICLYMDELQGWINKFTRYNKGSEEQFYISLFNGYMYISDRKMNTNNIMIDSPFSNVIGTIQPEILIDTFKGSKSNNGFLDRILFAIPEIQDKLYWKDDDIDMSHFNEWNTIMQSFIKMKIEHDEHGNINPTRLEYESGARQKVMEWQHQWADMLNMEESDKRRSIYSKFETYIHRFCLIIQLCKWVCNEGDKNCIDLDSVLKSIRLVSYFKNTALQICSMIEGVMLTPKQTELLEKLPDKFTRSEGLEVAVSMNWSTSTYDRFLKKATGTYLYHEYGNYKKAQ